MKAQPESRWNGVKAAARGACLSALVAAAPLAGHAQTQATASTVDLAGGEAGPYGADVPPLFTTSAALELRIEADFGQIRRDRDEENPEHPGLVYVLDADGSESEWPVQVRTRGNFRLQSNTCDFPPIRLNFATSDMEGGPFAGQDKLKLVTHCRDRYEPNVLREFLAYRIYNHVTPASFRVRLARVTYLDTSGREDTMTRLAFFIEMEEALGERLGGRVIADEDLTEGLHPGRISAEDAMRVDLFQYMVGNTDYSLYLASENGGLHNIMAVEREGTRVLPVPYDFDWTGLVDARYAKPSPQLGIRSVTDRLYRGLCRPNIDYAAAYAAFLELRGRIDGMISGLELLEEDDRRSAIRYLEEFWETLGDERRSERRIAGACRNY